MSATPSSSNPQHPERRETADAAELVALGAGAAPKPAAIGQLKRVGSWSACSPRERLRAEKALPEESALKALRRGEAAPLLVRVRRWLGRMGSNGGVLPNGGVLAVAALQCAAWLHSERLSIAIAKASGLPAGRRRPDAYSFPGRLIGWLVENGAVITLCNLRGLLPHPEPIPDERADASSTLVQTCGRCARIVARNVAISIVSNMIAETGSVLIHHLASTRLYSKVPYFVKQRRSANPLTLGALADWVRGNGVLQLFGGGLMLGLIESFLPAAAAAEVTNTPFTVGGFLRNFAVFRVVVDVAFYCGHRALHEHPLLYKHIHKRHHEHFTTNLRTNYHFTAPDLFIESAVPVFAGLAVLRKLLGVALSRFEIHLMLTYVAWHESGTHLGKPLPVISMYPPLSILYTPFTDVEATAIEFHEVHHNRRSCNYGITQWIDYLMGSRLLRAGGAGKKSPAA